jgi:predicted transposase YbfD/YdcC
LKSLGIATLVCVRDGKETIETRYYISSLPVSVKLFAHAVRSHWGIENSCHWSLDKTYREDESRIRDPHLRENFAWLNRFTLSLLKQHPGKDSIAMKRRACGWSEEFLAEMALPFLTANHGKISPEAVRQFAQASDRVDNRFLGPVHVQDQARP